MMSHFVRRCCGIVLTAAAVTVLARAGVAADDDSGAKPPKNIVAIRLASFYRGNELEALPLAAECGFKYVFMSIIPPDKVDQTQAQLAKYGLKVAVFRGDTDLCRPTSVDELAGQLAVCQKMGVHYMFLSPKHTGVSKEVAIERLKKIGDVAKKYDVVIGLETHRDLGTNGDVHVETMKSVNHPNIRVNFDCGNITYYNQGADAVTELRKCIDYVGTFEIKDHSGEYETWNFPVLGTGVVDIPGVVKLLREHGYRGPITLEIEGVKDVKRSNDEIKKEIAASADYVRKLGLLD